MDGTGIHVSLNAVCYTLKTYALFSGCDILSFKSPKKSLRLPLPRPTNPQTGLCLPRGFLPCHRGEQVKGGMTYLCPAASPAIRIGLHLHKMPLFTGPLTCIPSSGHLQCMKEAGMVSQPRKSGFPDGHVRGCATSRGREQPWDGGGGSLGNPGGDRCGRGGPEEFAKAVSPPVCAFILNNCAMWVALYEFQLQKQIQTR